MTAMIAPALAYSTFQRGSNQCSPTFGFLLVSQLQAPFIKPELLYSAMYGA